MPEPIVIIFFAVALVLGLVVVALTGNNSSQQLRKRALGLNGRGKKKSSKKSQVTGPASLRRTQAKQVPLLEDLAKRLLPRQDELKARLARTGFEVSVGSYALVSMLVALVGGLALLTVAGLPAPPSALGGVAIGLLLPHVAVGFLSSRRTTKFMNVLPDAIDLIVRGLKSGLPVTESMAAAGREMPDPLGFEFRRVTDTVRLGRGLEEVLWETAKRLRTPEFNFFVISLGIQRETGGNLAETLANLSDILRKRKQMRLKIRALSAEARASAWILGALPFLMLGMIHVMSPDYAAVLFEDPRGHAMLIAGGALLVTCFLVMAKLIRFEI
jgi:tight adherence protein B